MSHPQSQPPLRSRRAPLPPLTDFDPETKDSPAGQNGKVSRPASFHVARRQRSGGFALLITITLLAFLVLLLVSLASLTRVETQVAGNSQQISRARANALFALNTALGQLQQFAGPDQRATVRADLGDGTNNTRPVPQNGSRQWTGVWGNAAAPTADRSSPIFLNWLVSGNEAVSVQANADGSISSAAASPAGKPDDTIPSLTNATALSTDLTVGSQSARLLVGPGTVGTAASGGQGEAGYVVAPLRDIKAPASSAPGMGATSGDLTVGRYAWWAGDEGVKARANLVESEDAITAAADADKRLRYRAPARTGVELMTNAPASLADADLEGSGTAALRTEIRKVLAPRQLALASGGAFPAAFLQQHFHDLSTTSRGVLANTLAGGLRQDLTAAFAQGTGKTDAPTGPIWQVGSADSDKGADWQLLRSYYQLPFSGGASGSGSSLSLDPQPQVDGVTDATQPAKQGVFPVVAFWQWYIEARLNGGPGTYNLELRHYPAIVLWNPYNVTLKNHAYRVTYSINGNNITFARVSAGKTTDTYTTIPAAIAAEAQLATPWTGGMNLTVQSGDLEPGTAYVYTLPANVAFTTDTFTPYTLTRGWHGGGTCSVIATGAPFTVPGAVTDYVVSFWTGTNSSGATNTVPAWSSATGTVPTTAASGSGTEPTLRDDRLVLQTAAGETLQDIRSNNTYEHAYKVRFGRGKLLYRPLTNPVVGYVGHRWALKTTALGTLTTTTLDKNDPVRWLADYNPRAPLSARSPFEMQGTGYGYFSTNPNYNFTSSGLRYASGAFDPVNAGAAIDCDPSTGRAFVGMSQSTWDGTGESTVVLFNIPRKEQPVVSLGELQHAQSYRVSNVSFASNASPAYALGNSFADPRGNLGTTSKPWSEIAIGSGSGYFSYKTTARVFDHSYLLNRALWDGYYFSTVPRGASGSAVPFPLPNPRLVLNDRDSADLPGDLRDSRKSASSLLVSGAFNINSTSAQAWRAVLGALNNVPVGSTRKTKASPYSRLPYPYADSTVLDATATNAGMKAEAYEGYRFLTADQINALADQIMVQVRRRGPFISLADFVNRALDAGPVPATQDNRLMGALARALKDANINTAFSGGQQAVMPPAGSGYTAMNEPAAAGDTATHLPGWVSQADLLQALGPVISARSDTFTLRAYGETVNPLLAPTDAAYIQGRAWCEAVVQRLPDYVAAGDDPWTSPTALTKSDNKTFGRRFKIISFRWLSSSDI